MSRRSRGQYVGLSWRAGECQRPSAGVALGPHRLDGLRRTEVSANPPAGSLQHVAIRRRGRLLAQPLQHGLGN